MPQRFALSTRAWGARGPSFLASIAFVLSLTAASNAWAGMPFVRLTELGKMRLESISFFIVLICLLTLLVKWLWNALQRDFPSLPRLSFKAALGGVGLWALAMHLVLSMIAGGRELMTPGAWQKEGATYKLAAEPKTTATPETTLQHVRTKQLERLRTALWTYSKNHEGQFPPHDYVREIPESTWQVVDPSELHYVYIRGLLPDKKTLPVAYEPGIYGKMRMTLLSNGEIKRLDIEEISQILDEHESKKVAP